MNTNRTAHADCTHEATKAARAACRKAAVKAEVQVSLFYCTTCFQGGLISSLTCDRSPRADFKATCLHCCDHNHG